ncbi:MAG TPA: tripartite tricarboxylate transporter substrate binding protein [Bordetella sp.]
MHLFKNLTRLLAAAALCGAAAAHAQYPDKPIRLVVPFPPGAGTDATARLIANELSPLLGQPVIVENRVGAGGSIGAQWVADAEPDGYTLFFSTTGALVINPHLYKHLRYDGVKSFTPIGMVASSANVLVVNPQVPAHSVTELIQLAKSEPGKLTYGSSGIGSSSHLAVVMLESLSGTKFTHIPYKGSAPAVTDLVGGRIDLMIDNIPSHVELVKAGKERALGVSGTNPSPLFPGLPTIAQAGVPGYDVTIWYGILGPAGMPGDVVQKLSTLIRQAVTKPGMAEKLQAIGSDPLVQSPTEFASYIKSEDQKWARIVLESGATAD